ncbi:MAG: MBL fold metallo-hydrolase [Dehalococcoidia bacterium]|nr:MBL fold metallo-hydrolase [Dehalococcoidia bacterium]
MAKMIYRTVEIMPFGTNCYLVASEQTRDAMVIDPASDGAGIMKNIGELGLRVGLVVVTHAHPDHYGAARPIVESTGASFAIHNSDVELLQIYDYSRQFTMDDPGSQAPPVPDRILTDNDSLVIGDLTFRVLHIPGHSAGGICIEGHGVVFSGDTLFNGSVARTDFPGGDHNLLISGIRSKLLVLPDQTVVLPGHGPKTTIGREKRGNPFLRRTDRAVP